jgi:hypothetical protein
MTPADLGIQAAKQDAMMQAAGHSTSCDVHHTGRYTPGCPGCQAEKALQSEMHAEYAHAGKSARYYELKGRLNELEARNARAKSEAETRRKTPRQIAIERAHELLNSLEENHSDAEKDGNEVWAADLTLILEAIYAADLPTKDGTLRIELHLAGDRPMPPTGYFASRRTA